MLEISERLVFCIALQTYSYYLVPKNYFIWIAVALDQRTQYLLRIKLNDGSNVRRNNVTISCYLIGDNNIVVKCAEILSKINSRILGVITVIDSVLSFCLENQIPTYTSIDNLLKSQPTQVDYIFSIVNNQKLSDKVLSLARFGAINYHNSLLPKYAGYNSITWALLNKEKEFGITWHMMTSKLDAGDIVKQKKIHIKETDCASDLSLKCYEAAVIGFEELVRDIQGDQLIAAKQDLSNRKLYSLKTCLLPFEWIDEYKSAEEIHLVHKSINYQNHENRLSCLKVFLDNQLFLINKVKVLDKIVTPPGCIIHVSKDSLELSTTTKVIQITELLDPFGNVLNMHALKIPEDKKIRTLLPSDIALFNKLKKKSQSDERLWLKEFSNFRKSQFYASKFLYKTSQTNAELYFYRHEVSFNDSICFDFNCIFSLFVFSLWKFNAQKNISVFVESDVTNTNKALLSSLFSKILPFSVAVNPQLSFTELVNSLQEKLKFINNLAPLSVDIWTRYPDYLSSGLIEDSILVTDSNSFEPDNLNNKLHSFVCCIDASAKNIVLYAKYNKGKLNFTKSFISTLFDFLASSFSYFSINAKSTLRAFSSYSGFMPGNSNKHVYQEASNIYDHFLHQANAKGNKIAIADTFGKRTYNEVIKLIEFYQKKFLQFKLTPHDCVVIISEKKIEVLVSILTLIKLKVPYVCVDLKFSTGRLKEILNTLNPRLIVATQKDELKETFFNLFNIYCLASNSSVKSTKPFRKDVKNLGHNPLYIIYTSGSTGKPKGIVISHDNLNNIIEWAKDEYTESQLSGVLASSSFTFDLSVFETIVALCCGGRVYLIDKINQLNNYPHRNKITLINTVPSAIQMLIGLGEIPSSVNTINLAGEPLSQKLLMKVFQRSQASSIYNLYGPTECTIYTSFKKFTSQRCSGHVSIGKLVPNMQAVIVDKYKGLLPKYAVGELYLSGLSVFNGYLSKNGKVSNDVLIDFQGKKYYPTGDMVIALAPDDITYVGRNDNQVKINGYRVELNEVDFCLSNIPNILQSKTIYLDNNNQGIYSFVIADGLSNLREKSIYGWQKIYDHIYSKHVKNSRKNFSGWFDAKTRKAIPIEHMEDWIDCTVKALNEFDITNCAEIGVGLGLVLFNIKNQYKNYYASDISKASIDYVKKVVCSSEPSIRSNITLIHADGISSLSKVHKKLNLLILNSVIQYFPDEEYLARLLVKSKKILLKNGTIFIGDIPDLRVLDSNYSFDASKELVYSPCYFFKYLFDGHFSGINILLKPSKYSNDLTQNRFDVTLFSALEFVCPVIKREVIVKNERDIIDVLSYSNSHSSAIFFKLAKHNSVFFTKHSFHYLSSLCSQKNFSCYYLAPLCEGMPIYVMLLSKNLSLIKQKTIVSNFQCKLYRESTNKNTNNILQNKITEASVKNSLKAILPIYMQPKEIIFLQQFPLTASGKVNTKLLEKIITQQKNTYLSEEIFEDKSVQQIVVAIWKNHLNISSSLKPGDNFFNLGGHSLHAINIIDQVKKFFDVDLHLSDIYHHATLERFVKLIENKVKNTKTVLNECLLNNLQENRFRCLISQKELWSFQEYNPNSSNYNLPVVLELSSELDIIKFKSSLVSTVSSISILNSSFHKPANTDLICIKQKNRSNVSFTHKVVDISRLQDQLRKDFNVPFDLKKIPLCRFFLYQVSKKKYYFMMVFHHIISDGASITLFLQRLSSAYNTGISPRVDDGFFYYVKYWHEKYSSEKIKSDRNSLENLFKFSAEPTSLFLKRYRSSGHSQYKDFMLNKKTTKKVLGFCKDFKCTPYVFYLTLFMILLGKYSSSSLVTIGTVFSNRDNSRFKNIFGYLAGTTAVQLEMVEKKTITDHLEQVQNFIKNISFFSEFPYSELSEIFRCKLKPKNQNMFNIAFVMLDDFSLSLQLDGISIKPYNVDYGTSKFDLILYAQEARDEIRFYFEFDSKLYDVRSVSDLYNNFLNFINLTIDSVSPKSLEEYHLISTTKQQKPIVKNYFRKEISEKEDSIYSRFEKICLNFPDKIAISNNDMQYTYRFLLDKAKILASNICSTTNTDSKYIGVFLKSHVDSIISIIAIFSLGKAYIPLHPSWPIKKIKGIILESGMKILIADNFINELSSFVNIVTYNLLQKTTQLKCHSYKDTANQLSKNENNIAYAIFTSGSTGKPKGVAVNQNSVLKLLDWAADEFLFSSSDVWTLFHSLAFDFSVWEMWGALLFGGKLVIVDDEVRYSADKFYKLIQQSKITILNQTPTAFYQLLRELVTYSQVDLTSLRFIFFGGEALDYKLLSAWYDHHISTHSKLINMYGITEGCIHVTYHYINFLDICCNYNVIGKPIPHCHVAVVLENGNEAPIGVIGELCLYGQNILEHYLVQDHSDLASNRISSLVINNINRRIYRTGDLVRWINHETLEYCGRLDKQISFHGYRIDLNEIEYAINNFRFAFSSFVQLINDRIVAYVVPKKNQSIDVAALRKSVGDILPSYMIPHYFILITDFPRTDNGKINLAKLPEVKFSNERKNNQLISSSKRSFEVNLLVTTYADIFGENNISIEASFFDLGGDSIYAMQISAALRKLSYNVSIQAVYKYNIRDLSEYLVKNKTISMANKNTKNLLEDDLFTKPIHLAPIQRWFFLQKVENINCWSQFIIVNVQKRLCDIDKLKTKLITLVKSHMIFKLRFKKSGPNWIQNLSDSRPLAFFVNDNISSIRSIENLSAQYSSKINISSGPVFIAVYFPKVGKYGTFLFMCHHLYIDAVSWKVILKQLSELFSGAYISNEVDTTYLNWLCHSHEIANNSCSQYLSTLYAKNSACDLSDKNNFYGKMKRKEFSCNLTGLHGLFTKETRIDSILISVFYLALSQTICANFLVFDIETHGRQVTKGIDLSSAIGWFTGIFPIHMSSYGFCSLRTLVSHVNNFIHYFFENFSEAIFSYLPSGAANILFNFLGEMNQKSSNPYFKIHQGKVHGIFDPRWLKKHFVEFNSFVEKDCLSVCINYNSDFISSAKIDAFVALVQHIIADKYIDKRFFAHNPVTPHQDDWFQYLHQNISIKQNFVAFKLNREISFAKLSKAWSSLLSSEISLSGVFSYTSPVWVREMTQELPSIEQVIHDSSELSSDFLKNLFLHLNQQPKVSHSIPIHLFLINNPHEKESYLVFNYLSMLLDGWSFSNLVKKLGELYFGKCNGLSTDVRISQHNQFSMLQRFMRDNSAILAASNVFHEACCTSLPLYFPKKQAKGKGSFTISYSLPVSLVCSMKKAQTKLAVTSSVLMQAAWSLLLYTYSPNNQSMFGLTVSGRGIDPSGAQDLLGLFSNVLPVYVDLQSTTNVVELLHKLQSKNHDLAKFDFVNLDAILSPVSKICKDSHLQTVLSFQNYVYDQAIFDSFADADIVGFELSVSTPYPLLVIIYPGDAVDIKFIADADYFTESFVRELGVKYSRIIKHLLNYLDGRLENLLKVIEGG